MLGSAGVPRITDAEMAKADPELAMLSAMSHGQSPDHETALRIALVAAGASVGLDAERQGQVEGKAEGKAELVLNLLRLKFSKLNAATKRRVETASAEDLDRYAARILKAKTLDDVFKKR
jgi:hypothetical protein